MNWVDGVILFVLFLFGLMGVRRGFLILFTEILGFVIAVGIAYLTYRPLGQFFHEIFRISYDVGKAVAFIFVFFIIQLIYFASIRPVYRRIPVVAHRSPFNRGLGFILGIFEGIVLVALLLTAIIMLPSLSTIRNTITHSRIGSWMIEQTRPAELAAQDIFGDAIRETAKPLIVEPKSNERVSLGFKTTNVQIDLAVENQMLQMVNRERTKRGLHLLKMDPKLQAVARAYSRDMLARGYFSHVNPEGKTPDQRMRAGGARFTWSGENLALAPSVQIAHKGLMESPGHRANILMPEYRKVGIGAVRAPYPYGIMFTQDFSN
jgi:uncharacterized protein YkwD